MEKVKIKKDFWPIIESVIIVGTETSDKMPNFLTCSWHSRVNQKPPQWGITIDHKRYSLECIKRNMTFSINYPSEELVRKADYCGLYSRKNVEKDSLFSHFSGSLHGAPMIIECMVNIELEVVKVIDLASDCLIIGEIINTFIDEKHMKDGHIDYTSLNSFYLTYPDFNYYTKKNHIGKAWHIGKTLD